MITLEIFLEYSTVVVFLSKIENIRSQITHVACHPSALPVMFEEEFLFKVTQYVFCEHHSRESAHLKAVDSGDAAVLVVIDLCAAFDTTDHETLTAWLKWLVGICGTFLKSCPTNRSFPITLGERTRSPASLTRGIPQGSILGPICFHCTCFQFDLFLENTEYCFTDPTIHKYMFQ